MKRVVGVTRCSESAAGDRDELERRARLVGVRDARGCAACRASSGPRSRCCSRCSPGVCAIASTSPVDGSRTIAVASFAPHLETVSRSTFSACAWIVWSSVVKTSAPCQRRPGADHVDRPAGRVAHDRLLAGAARRACGRTAARARRARDRRRPRSRAPAPPPPSCGYVRSSSGYDATPAKPFSRKSSAFCRVGEPLDVDELLFLFEQLRVERVRVDAEDLVRRERDRARVAHLLRVGVDRRLLLADRELDAGAVEDRAAPGGDLLGLLVLALREAREMRRLHALQPDRAREHRREDEREDAEQEPDPAVGLLLAHRRRHQRPRSM